MKKKFGKINIVDLCIVVLICAIAGGAYLFLKNSVEESSVEKDYKITLELRMVEEDLVKNIQTDKAVYDRVQNKEIGTLLDMKYEPSVEYSISSVDGSVKKVTVPNKYDCFLDIELATEQNIFIGKFLSVATKDFMGAGYIIDFEEITNK